MAMSVRSVRGPTGASLACLIFAATLCGLHGLDSIAACAGSALYDPCQFQLPSVEDRWEDIQSAREGAWRGGVCSRFGRSSIQNATSGELLLFCRAVPTTEELEACDGKGRGRRCWIRQNESIVLNLKAFTTATRYADTKAPVFVSFLMDGNAWTPPSHFFKGARTGQARSRRFILPSWPRKLAFSIQDSDAWSFWKIVVNGIVILEDPSGKQGSDRYRSYHAGKTTSPPSRFDDFTMSKYWVEGPPASQGFPMPVVDNLDTSAIPVAVATADKAHAETRGCVWAAFLVSGVWKRMDFFCGAGRGDVKEKVFDVGGHPSRVQLGLDSTDEWAFWKVSIAGVVVHEDPAGHRRGEQFSVRQRAFSYWMEGPGRTTTFDVPSAPGQNQVATTRSLPGRCWKAWVNRKYCETGSTQIVDQYSMAEAMGMGQALQSQGSATTPCDAASITYSSLGSGYAYGPNRQKINYCLRESCWAENQTSCEAVCSNWHQCQGYSFGHFGPGSPVTCILFPKAAVRWCPGAFRGAFDRGDHSLEAVDRADQMANWTLPLEVHRKAGDSHRSCTPSSSCPVDTDDSTEKTIEGEFDVRVANVERFTKNRNAYNAVIKAVDQLAGIRELRAQGFEVNVELSVYTRAPSSRRLQGSASTLVQASFVIFLRGGRATVDAALAVEARLQAKNPRQATVVLQNFLRAAGVDASQVEVTSITMGADPNDQKVTAAEKWTAWSDKAEQFGPGENADEETMTIEKSTLTGLMAALIATGVVGLCLTVGLSVWIFRLRRKVRLAAQCSNTVQGADVAIGRPVETSSNAAATAMEGAPVQMVAEEKPKVANL